MTTRLKLTLIFPKRGNDRYKVSFKTSNWISKGTWQEKNKLISREDAENLSQDSSYIFKGLYNNGVKIKFADVARISGEMLPNPTPESSEASIFRPR